MLLHTLCSIGIGDNIGIGGIADLLRLCLTREVKIHCNSIRSWNSGCSGGSSSSSSSGGGLKDNVSTIQCDSDDRAPFFALLASITSR